MPLSRADAILRVGRATAFPAMGLQCCPTMELHSQPPQLTPHTAVSLPTQSVSLLRSVLCTEPLSYGL